MLERQFENLSAIYRRGLHTMCGLQAGVSRVVKK
jgi:hypothetical protein